MQIRLFVVMCGKLVFYADNGTIVKEKVTDYMDELIVAGCWILNVYPKPVAFKWIIIDGLFVMP